MNITHDNIITLILDPKSRADLFKAIALENNTGTKLKTANAVLDAIYNLNDINESEMIQIKDILLKEGNAGENILAYFVSNKYFPEQLLYELLDDNKYILALCHKREPSELLAGSTDIAVSVKIMKPMLRTVRQ